MALGPRGNLLFSKRDKEPVELPALSSFLVSHFPGIEVCIHPAQLETNYRSRVACGEGFFLWSQARCVNGVLPLGNTCIVVGDQSVHFTKTIAEQVAQNIQWYHFKFDCIDFAC